MSPTDVPHDRLGSIDQLALVTRRPALDVRVHGGIDLRIHPDRGFDVGAAWFRGVNLAWISAAGDGGTDGADWRESWGGGLVTTCGLDNVGAASEGIGLHGSWMFLPASDVQAVRTDDEVVCSATIEDPRGLRVARTVRTRIGEGRVELTDVTVNVSAETLEAPLLYHVNVGWPVWDAGSRVESDATDVVPRDADAAPHDWGPAPEPDDVPERVWEHVGATRSAVVGEKIGLRVEITSSLPRLWQWVAPQPGTYALALEPANCSVLGRAHDRAEGTLPVLRSGEERTTSLVVEAEER